MTAGRFAAFGAVAASVALGAAYLWATRGSAILLDLSAVFCL